MKLKRLKRILPVFCKRCSDRQRRFHVAIKNNKH